MKKDAAELLGPDGPLARQVPGFAPRLPQQRMAQAVEDILETGGALIVEAGTGTGKTFAYLIPALQSGARVIISTGTRHLQDQLFNMYFRKMYLRTYRGEFLRFVRQSLHRHCLSRI